MKEIIVEHIPRELFTVVWRKKPVKKPFQLPVIRYVKGRLKLTVTLKKDEQFGDCQIALYTCDETKTWKQLPNSLLTESKSKREVRKLGVPEEESEVTQTWFFGKPKSPQSGANPLYRILTYFEGMLDISDSFFFGTINRGKIAVGITQYKEILEELIQFTDDMPVKEVQQKLGSIPIAYDSDGYQSEEIRTESEDETEDSDNDKDQSKKRSLSDPTDLLPPSKKPRGKEATDDNLSFFSPGGFVQLSLLILLFFINDWFSDIIEWCNRILFPVRYALTYLCGVTREKLTVIALLILSVSITLYCSKPDPLKRIMEVAQSALDRQTDISQSKPEKSLTTTLLSIIPFIPIIPILYIIGIICILFIICIVASAFMELLDSKNKY